MNAPSDSDRRKAKVAALCSQDEAIAQHLEEARRSGELQGTPGFGKPMQEMEGWNETPTEFRLPFKILKNAGVAPPEIELFHTRAALRKELAEAESPARRIELQQRLSELEQLIALRLAGMRSSGKL